jgi:hypothetical protein
MDGQRLYSRLRKALRKRRQELLEGLVGCEDIQKQRGRVLELDVTYAELDKIMKDTTTGDDDDDI